MKIKKYFLVIILMLNFQVAEAFDNIRQGFILGLGAGFHTLNVDFNFNGSKIASDSETGLATSFKIGGGITNQLALYYVRNASWYSAPSSNGFVINNITYEIGISGIGLTYFLSPTAPSGYFLGAVGVGDIDAPFEDNIKADTGSAVMIGGGYETANHMQLEATLLSTDIDSSDDSRFNLKSSSVQFTFNYMFY